MPSLAATDPLDADGDGVPNAVDTCVFKPDKDNLDGDKDGVGDVCDRCRAVSSELVDAIGGPSPVVDRDGCTVSQGCPCTGPRDTAKSWPRRKRYLGCVRRVTRKLLRRRVIGKSERHAIGALVRSSRCGFDHSLAGDMDGDGVGDDGDPKNKSVETRCKGGAAMMCFDNCPRRRNAKQRDQDMDSIGDVCDPERDGDGVRNDVDNCPTKKNETQADGDDDGVGDSCDLCLDSTEGADVDGKGCE